MSGSAAVVAIPAQDMVERALALSSADHCVAIATEVAGANLRWANNTVTTNGDRRGRNLTVIALVNGRSGVAAGVVSRAGEVGDSLEDLVRSADWAARQGAAVPEAEPLVRGSTRSPNWNDPPAVTSMHVLAGVVRQLTAIFSRARQEKRLLFGYAHHTSQSVFVASSAGLRLRHDQLSGYLELNAKSLDHAASVWSGVTTRYFTDVDACSVDDQLASRLATARRRIHLPAGRYETLLAPSAVADLMMCLYERAGARDASDGRSAFSNPAGGTRVGEPLTPIPITLRSNPSEPGLSCLPFVVAHSSGDTNSVFDNGVALAPTDWIRDGVLRALVQTRHSARLNGLAVTPQIQNLILEGPPGGRGLGEMIRHTQHGLLLSCVSYVREVDARRMLLSGLTRDGVFVVEDGEIVGAVNNFRFNESPVEMLQRIAETGASEAALPREERGWFTETAMAPLRIAGFNMSSVSEAT